MLAAFEELMHENPIYITQIRKEYSYDITSTQTECTSLEGMKLVHVSDGLNAQSRHSTPSRTPARSSGTPARSIGTPRGASLDADL
jgi:hypothetical protein